MGAHNRVTAITSKMLALGSPKFFASKVRNPCFFVGCGRSGTSLLANLLATHRDIAVYPYEANELWHPQLFPWHRSHNGTAPIWVDPYAFTQASLKARSKRDDKRLQAVFGAYQFMFRQTHFVNKSVMVSFMIPHILQLFPDARFVHLVRDGRAVALSYAIHDRKTVDRFPSSYKKMNIDFPIDILVKKFAEYWKQHILEIEEQKAVLDLTTKGLIIELRYEDLCLNPNKHLSLIAEFMGLEPDKFAYANYSYVKNTNYKYQKELSIDTIQEIEAIMQPALTLKGYSS